VPERTDLMTIISASAGLVGAVLAGVLLRMLFGRLARRAEKTERPWDDLGWALLRTLAIPISALFGLWWAAQALRPREPVRGVFDHVLLGVTVLVVALAIARLAGDVVRSVTMARSGVASSATIFVNVTRVVIVAIGLLVVLQSLGISVTPMLTALGVGGLAVALALQGTLANVFAGIQILASKKVQPGDFVRLDSGENGSVVDINWRNTTIQQLAGNIIIVPNSRLGDTILTNFHQPATEMSVLVQVGVAYSSDLEHVERVTVEVGSDVMTTVEGGVPSHEPFIRYHTFADSSINFSVILRTAEYTGQYRVVHEFIKRLHRRYRDEGIEIPFPIRTVVHPAEREPATGVIPTQAGHPG
jgi:small-conductance mechanosensitive channel